MWIFDSEDLAEENMFLLRLLLRPIVEKWAFTVLLFVLISAASFTIAIGEKYYCYAVYLLSLFWLLSYILSLLSNSCSFFSHFLNPVLIIGSAIYALMGIVCYFLFGVQQINGEIIAILNGTNLGEVLDFLKFYISPSLWMMIIIGGILLLGLYYWTDYKAWKASKVFCVFYFCICVCSVTALSHNPSILKSYSLSNIEERFHFDEVVPLAEHMSDPIVEEISTIHPHNILVIIGESHSRSHSMLYGWRKPNEPLLKNLQDKGLLFVFNNVESPFTWTIASFKYIMNTNTLDTPFEKWYDATTIQEVFKKTGYQLSWVSNQSNYGIVDNLPASFSSLCDTVVFAKAGNKDEITIKHLKEIKDTFYKKCTSNLTFVHLMGQHADYESRYPDNYAIFTSDNYKDFPYNQRKNLAAYDNATLYNDFVVSELMSQFSEDDAIVVYFPDHGQDMYESDSDYCSHSKRTPESEAFGKRIPFMVYVSEKHQDRNPWLITFLKENLDNEYCTDHFIFFLMKISGFSFSY